MSSKIETIQQQYKFVISLANPMFVYSLAKSKKLYDPDFIDYLDSLLYWTKPPYCTRIEYPLGLAMLSQLQNAEFRKNMSYFNFVQQLEEALFCQWLYKHGSYAVEESSQQPQPSNTSTLPSNQKN